MTEQTSRYLREREVVERVGVSRVTIRRWEKQGLFPRRIQLGPNSVGWLESEFLIWQQSRLKQRDCKTV